MNTQAPAPAGTRRWKRRSEARPEEILEAALDEFTERGFDAARMEDIARRAGLSKAGVYLYFPSKEALLKALTEAKVAPLARHARALADSGAADPLSVVRMLAHVAAEKIADPRVFAVPRLILSVANRFPDVAEHYRVNVVEIARGALEDLLRAAMAKGQIRKLDAGAASRAFIGPLLFEAMWMHILGGESGLKAPKKMIEQHFDILLNGLEQRA